MATLASQSYYFNQTISNQSVTYQSINVTDISLYSISVDTSINLLENRANNNDLSVNYLYGIVSAIENISGVMDFTDISQNLSSLTNSFISLSGAHDTLVSTVISLSGAHDSLVSAVDSSINLLENKANNNDLSVNYLYQIVSAIENISGVMDFTDISQNLSSLTNSFVTLSGAYDTLASTIVTLSGAHDSLVSTVSTLSGTHDTLASTVSSINQYNILQDTSISVLDENLTNTQTVLGQSVLDIISNKSVTDLSINDLYQIITLLTTRVISLETSFQSLATTSNVPVTNNQTSNVSLGGTIILGN